MPKPRKPSPVPGAPAPNRAVVAVVSDLHIGSTVGLCPPDGIELEDGGLYQPSKVQGWIWDKWRAFWQQTYALAEGLPLVVVVNGEFVDGNHHGTTQIGTASPEMMRRAALAVFSATEIRKRATAMYATKGTAAHSQPGGQSDEAVAAALKCERDPETRQAAFYHLLLDVCGVRFDIAHHIGASTRPWTKGTNIRAEVLMAMEDGYWTGRVPDVVVRSHVHNFADTGLNFRTRGFVTPAWQLKTEFAHKVTRSLQRRVGGLVFRVENGTAEPLPLIYELPPPTAVTALA